MTERLQPIAIADCGMRISLECGDLSPLWSVATCRDHRWTEVLKDLGVKPPKTKAVTGHRTPKLKSAIECNFSCSSGV